MNKIKLVHELDTQTRSLAVAAYAAAHGSAPDFGFAPDRGWVEGWAYAQTAAPAPAAVAVPDATPTDSELMKLSDECMQMPGGLGMHYLNYGREILSRWGSAQAQDVQRDAERYRWLRENATRSGVNIDIGAGVEISDTLDAAIDAAIAASAAQGEA